jgi:hypothetical protein
MGSCLEKSPNRLSKRRPSAGPGVDTSLPKLPMHSLPQEDPDGEHTLRRAGAEQWVTPQAWGSTSPQPSSSSWSQCLSAVAYHPAR